MYQEFCDLSKEQALEYLQKSKNYVLRIALQEVIERHTGTILDVGCGNGIEAKWYNPRRYCGADISPPLIWAAKRYNPLHTFVLIPIGGLPFKNESFDIVFAMGVLEHQHSMEEARTLFNEMLRVSKKVVAIAWHTPPGSNDTQIIQKTQHFGKTGYANKYNVHELTRDFIGSMIKHEGGAKVYQVWEILKKHVTAQVE